ncbi:MAG: hypothetical protein JKP97_21155, partial [Rhodobacteraceae bacterium]|nr:hypothetical protein [Paracoccaceae bacterium]
MADKEATVDAAIEEVAAANDGGVSGVKEALNKASSALESASSTLEQARGKAVSGAREAAERTKIY